MTSGPELASQMLFIRAEARTGEGEFLNAHR
jgi:hypothetical protein